MRRSWRVTLVFCLLGWIHPTNGQGESASWESSIRPPIAEDLNPDPSIVEVELTAAPIQWDFGNGTPVTVWAYNGSVPGPTIMAFEDDRVIVHFKNRLPIPSSIHWHGLEIPSRMAGSIVSHDPVEPGEDFRYEFRVPRAATYGYRSGHRPEIANEMGLHGAIIVEDPGTDLRLNLPPHQHLLVLDDIHLEAQTIRTAPPSDPVSRAAFLINGNEGQDLLVNGRRTALGVIDFTLPHRMRLINAANARFMNLEFVGAHVWRIGGDAGLLTSAVELLPPTQAQSGTVHHHKSDAENVIDLEAFGVDPYPPSRLLMTPGERADLIVVPDGADEITLLWHDFRRGIQSAETDDNGQIRFRHHHDQDGQRESVPMLRLFPKPDTVPIRLEIGTQLSWSRYPSGYSLEWTQTLGGQWEPFPGAIQQSGHQFSASIEELPASQAFFRLQKQALVRQHLGGVNYRPPNGLVDVQRIVPHQPKIISVIYSHSHPTKDGKLTMAATQAPPDAIPFPSLTESSLPTARVGEQIIWEIQNLTAQDQTFHLDGFPFQLLDSELIDDDLPTINTRFPARFIENKDTILIPKRPGREGKSRTVIRLITELDDWRREGQIQGSGLNPSATSAGGWLYGSSMLGAAELGMQSALQIR